MEDKTAGKQSTENTPTACKLRSVPGFALGATPDKPRAPAAGDGYWTVRGGAHRQLYPRR